MFNNIKEFYLKYEGRISSAALLGGFIFDNLTLQRIDLLFENLVIIFYLLLSGGGILLKNYFDEHSPQKNFFINLESFLPLFIQFAFGGLFSGFFIFYSRSATLSSSWPFVLILLVLLIGNEFFKKQYQRMTFQLSIYFVAVFSFSIFFLPVLTKSISPFIFVLSGIFSLIYIYLFLLLLSKIVPQKYLKSRKNLKGSIILLFVLINVLYFSNLIPPIPLSLKEAGVYHNVQRVNGSYKIVGEKIAWYKKIFSKETVHLRGDQEVYVFSSVFAPTDLNIEIIHDWQYFNKINKEWISASQIIFPIVGGRDGGYRGFSQKENIFPGKWRVDIKTERNQIIGRVNFNVETTGITPTLETKTL